MIDPDEMAAYEEWKAKKLNGHTDLSVAAFNAEMESQALAWEAGAKKAMKGREISTAELREILDQNPHRAEGMRGYRKFNHEPSGPGIGDGPGGSKKVIS